MYNKVTNGNPVEFEGQDIQTITSALKHYLRFLPEPLLTFSQHKPFLEAARKLFAFKHSPYPPAEIEDKFERAKVFRECLSQLPPLNKELLQVLVTHMKR